MKIIVLEYSRMKNSGITKGKHLFKDKDHSESEIRMITVG
jgi:hypothetical protein